MSRTWIAFVVALCACGDAPKTSNLSGGETQSASGSATGPGATDGATGETSDESASEGEGATSEGTTSEAGSSTGAEADATTATSAATTGTGTSDASTTQVDSSTGSGEESGSSSTGGGLIGPGGVLDVVIYAEDDCTFTTDPMSITVPEGTGFTVNWINHPTSDVEVDVAKIDQFNHVPILIGLEVGNSHHDHVHTWCGNLFSGTFSFRLMNCGDPHYIDVDCGGA